MTPTPSTPKPNASPRWLITGAAGFIGARLVEACAKSGIEIVSVDELRFFDERKEHQGLPFGTRVDRDALFAWLEADHPVLDGILHMGACSSTTELNEAFLQRVNVDYSKNLWNYAAIKKIPFYYASSAATYGDGESGYADEESLMTHLQPLNPYGNSKLRFDLWALEEERKGNHPPAWAGFKFFNVYGFGEAHKGGQASVVFHAFHQIQKQGVARLFKSYRAGVADGQQKRDFVSVEDVVDVLQFARKSGLRRGIYNLGTGVARSFHDLASAVFSAVKRPEQIDWIEMPAPLRDRYQYFTQAEMQKLRSQGYTRPFLTLEEGVKRYVQRLSEFK